MCYFMQPFSKFDIHGNPLVLFFDRYGITMINLKSQEVHLILSYEDQAHYYRKPPDPKATVKKDIQDKIKTANIDMWQKYNDCILCDSKSIPNAQGALLETSSRNILVGFNKTL